MEKEKNNTKVNPDPFPQGLGDTLSCSYEIGFYSDQCYLYLKLDQSLYPCLPPFYEKQGAAESVFSTCQSPIGRLQSGSISAASPGCSRWLKQIYLGRIHLSFHLLESSHVNSCIFVFLYLAIYI